MEVSKKLSTFTPMKWLTLKEYAKKEKISLAGAYKRVKEDRVKHDRKFGKLVVGVKEKELV